MNNVFKKVYFNIFSNFEKELKKAVGDSKSILDVGCGDNSPIRYVSNNIYKVGVDIHKPSIQKSKLKKIHNKYYHINILDLEKKFGKNSFDCVVALDIIEHLTKEEGYKLLKLLEKIAKHKVILFTPNGFLPQGDINNNPWQVHKSGWEVEEMNKKRYRVIGINGWRPLRKEFAHIKYRPKVLWRLFSDISEFFVKNNPEKAFQLLCIKNK